jgi:hypothetical protein
MENPVKTTHKLRTAQVRSIPPIVRLVHIPNATDADGEPRVALEVPPSPGALSRRPMLLMFASMAAALDSKRVLEGHR